MAGSLRMQLLQMCVSASDPEAVAAFFARFDEFFFRYCDKELCKINTFFSGVRRF